MKLKELFARWSLADRENLGQILEAQSCEPGDLEEAVWQAYNGNIRPAMKQVAKSTFQYFAAKMKNEQFQAESGRRVWVEPDYESLLRAACKEIKLDTTDAALEIQEIYFLQKLFVDVLSRLPAKERKEFLEKQFEMEEISDQANIPGPKLHGQVAILGALSVAQASGFGVYLLATTLLGTMTSVLGITLPFAIYTGLTSAIAVIIGPVGWAALGFSILWKLGGPNWKVLVPVLLYIITVEHRPPVKKVAL